MACVVEMPIAGAAFADEIRDAGIDGGAHSVLCVEADAVDREATIPTFDASDLDHHLEQSKSARLVWKSLIILASYNPLPLLRLALIRAHARGNDEPLQLVHRKRLSAVDLTDPNDCRLWDLEGQFPDDEGSRRELLVDQLPVPIQREFRNQVLQILLLYVSVITTVVAASLLGIPWTAARDLMVQSPIVSTVVQVALASVTILSLWLVYALRFDPPINYAPLAFLTATETACAVAFGVANDPFAVVKTMGLLVCAIVLLRYFAAQPASHCDDEELLCPAQAALRSIFVLAAVTFSLHTVHGDQVTHTTTSSLLGILSLVSLVLLWISLVLTVLSQTMAPEEATSALVFFQVDVVVLAVMEPSKLVLKYVRKCQRAVEQFGARNYYEALPPKSRSQATIVVPAFWPDSEKIEGSVSVAVAPRRRNSTVDD